MQKEKLFTARRGEQDATQAILLPSTVACFGPGSAGFRDGEFLRVFGDF